jgi:hypothetical protein
LRVKKGHPRIIIGPGIFLFLDAGMLVAGYRMPDAGYWMLVIGILTSNT